MNAYYTQQADQITTIFGVNSLEEAQDFSGGLEVIETDENIYMNQCTGSVDFESNWDAEGVSVEDLTLVIFDIDSDSWIAA